MKTQTFKWTHPPIRLVLWMRTVLLAAALLAPFGAFPVRAQAVPPACLNDQGFVPRPAPVVGAWAMVLNFNHAPSATTTIGCRITTVGVSPQQLSYTTPIQCVLRNNVNNVTVGGGSAPFDGKFWIQCPTGPKPPGLGPLHDSFYVYGRATFSTPSGSHTLLQHPDVAARIDVDANWHVKQTSRYAQTVFDNTDPVTNVAGVEVSFGSQVGNGTGSHFVNGAQLQPTTPVPDFPFDFSQPFNVGNQGQPWTLHEFIIDPPPRCCNPG